jgi:nitrite reductase/ring-hydroxylating ferredoxin subunit
MVSLRVDPVRLAQDPKRLGESQALAFEVRVEGVQREAFVVRWKGGLHAYLNTCRHQGLRLDFGDLHFFDDEYDALVCCHHGARYQPATGVCFDGPCEGARLTALRLEERADGTWCVGIAEPNGDSA